MRRDVSARCTNCDRVYVIPRDPDPRPTLCESCLQDGAAIVADDARREWEWAQAQREEWDADDDRRGDIRNPAIHQEKRRTA